MPHPTSTLPPGPPDYRRWLLKQSADARVFDILQRPTSNIRGFVELLGAYTMLLRGPDQVPRTYTMIKAIERHSLAFTPDDVRAFAEAGLTALREGKTNLDALVIPFISMPQEYERAKRMFGVVLDAILTEPLELGQNPPSLFILAWLLYGIETFRTWPHICEEYKRGDPAAKALLRKLFLLLELFNTRPKFVPYHASEITWCKTAAVAARSVAELRSIPRQASDRNLIPVPAKAVWALNSFYNSFRAEQDAARGELTELISRFASRLPEYETRCGEMWKQIRTDARRGLRPVGDVFRIAVPALNRVGYRQLHLVPIADSDDVRVNVRIWSEELGIHAIQTLTLRPHLFNRPAGQAGEPEHTDSLNDLLAYIAMTCYWEFSMGITHRKLQRAVRSGNAEAAETQRMFAGYHPAWRWLADPLRHHASERAKERSLKHHPQRREPPDGKTFYMSDPPEDGGANAEVVRFDRPLGIFRADDLEKSLGYGDVKTA